MRPTKPNLEIIKTIVVNSINELHIKDYYLFETKVKEECYNHRIAFYLEIIMPYYIEDIKYFNIDLEYDIQKGETYNTDVKKQILLNGDYINIRPDILIHQRGTNFFNSAIIEVKKHKCNEWDFKKIERVLKEKKYDFGLAISLNIAKGYTTIEIFTLQNEEVTLNQTININR